MKEEEYQEKVLNYCLEVINEDIRLRGLTNAELVAECLQLDAADYPVVQEMMTRLDPTWSEEKEAI